MQKSRDGDRQGDGSFHAGEASYAAWRTPLAVKSRQGTGYAAPSGTCPAMQPTRPSRAARDCLSRAERLFSAAGKSFSFISFDRRGGEPAAVRFWRSFLMGHPLAAAQPLEQVANVRRPVGAGPLGQLHGPGEAALGNTPKPRAFAQRNQLQHFGEAQKADFRQGGATFWTVSDIEKPPCVLAHLQGG